MKKNYSKELEEVIKNGIASDFWQKGVKLILEEEMKNLSEQILEDKKGERLDDAKRNHLIDLRLIMKNLKETIEEMAKPKDEVENQSEEKGFLHKEYD